MYAILGGDATRIFRICDAESEAARPHSTIRKQVNLDLHEDDEEGTGIIAKLNND
jgi:hypothetical protein